MRPRAVPPVGKQPALAINGAQQQNPAGGRHRQQKIENGPVRARKRRLAGARQAQTIVERAIRRRPTK